MPLSIGRAPRLGDAQCKEAFGYRPPVPHLRVWCGWSAPPGRLTSPRPVAATYSPSPALAGAGVACCRWLAEGRGLPSPAWPPSASMSGASSSSPYLTGFTVTGDTSPGCPCGRGRLSPPAASRGATLAVCLARGVFSGPRIDRLFSLVVWALRPSGHAPCRRNQCWLHYFPHARL